MNLALTDKVCVVTGSAKSIGLGIAQMYCREGAAAALIDIDPQVMEQSARLNAAGNNTKAFVTDITDQSAVFECFQEIENSLGPVYALANVAGYVDQQKIEDVTPERIDKVMQINVNGTVYCTQGALKSMRPLKNGRIINFSSKSGKTGSALMAAYSGAKGAIIAITHSLAFELAPDNIKVNCLCPGITGDTGVWDSVSQGYTKELAMPMEAVVEKFTDKIPLQRLANIQDIVAYTRFLTVDGDYCTGQALNVTGGREVH